MLLKRAQRGQLPLVEAVKKLQGELLSGPSLSVGSGDDTALVAAAKKVTLLCLGIAYQRYMDKLEQEQEVLAALTEMAMNAFAMESVSLRARKQAAAGSGTMAADYAAVFVREAMEIVESSARTLLAACSEGDALRTNLAVLKRLAKFEPVNAIAVRRQIAAKLLEAGKYVC
jgi:butyryl-CoA dehydrogenase